MCVYGRLACSTRELCQRVSDVGLGRTNAWWDRYEERWRAKPVEEQLNWLQHWGAVLVDEVLEYENVFELNIELAEANMRGFMECVDVLSGNRAKATPLAPTPWPVPSGKRPMLTEMLAPNAAAVNEGPVPAENIRWVMLPNGIGRALCVAHDWGAPSASIWSNADHELNCVLRGTYQHQDCNRLNNPSIRRIQLVQQAFTGTQNGNMRVAEA